MEYLGPYLGHAGVWFCLIVFITFIKRGINLKSDFIGSIIWSAILGGASLLPHVFLWGIK